MSLMQSVVPAAALNNLDMTALKRHSLKTLSSAIRIFKTWTLPIAIMAWWYRLSFFPTFLRSAALSDLCHADYKVTLADDLHITILHLILTRAKNMKNALIKLIALLAIQEAIG
ncbi:MAG: hypothetical protein ACI4NO_06490 [Oxalobacter sp.]